MFRVRSALTKKFNFKSVKELDRFLLRLLPEYSSISNILNHHGQLELEEMIEGELLIAQDTPFQIREIWNDVVSKLMQEFGVSKQHLFECLNYLYPGWQADKNRILDMPQRELLKDLRRTIYKRSELKRLTLLRRQYSGPVFNVTPISREEMEFEHLTERRPYEENNPPDDIA